MESNPGSENPRKIPQHSLGRLCASPSVSGKDLIAYRNDVLRRYDRQTMLVASGLLICTILGAVVVAVQEPEKKAAYHAPAENSISDNGAVNSNPTALSDVRSMNAESANSEMGSGQTISIDRTETVISPGKNSSPQMNPAEPIQTPAPSLISEVSEPNARWVSSVDRPDIARVNRPKICKSWYRASARLRFVDVKARLVALWHESLAQNKSDRGWAARWSSRKAKTQKLVTLTKAKRMRDRSDAPNQK